MIHPAPPTPFARLEPPSVRPAPRARRRPGALLAAAGALVVAAVLAACNESGVQTAPVPDNALREPLLITSERGLLEAELRAETVTVNVPDSGGTTRMLLRNYRLVKANGVEYDSVAFPGPTFRVRIGDRVRITLTNALPATPLPVACAPYAAAQDTTPRDSLPNCFHQDNSTNLHFHGFHVTPRGSGDNVLDPVAPGASFRYEFVVDPHQSPGTHWYHPHLHGTVALQVINGMSGGLIVEGALDTLVRNHHIREHLLAVQQVDSQVNLMKPVTGTNPAPAPMLVNGQYRPVVTMRPGEVQRWRIVNENVAPTANYALNFAGSPSSATGFKVLEIARDGVQFAPENYDPTGVGDTLHLLSPGNRLDVFVQAPRRAGTYDVTATPVGLLRARGSRLADTVGAVTAAQLFYVFVDTAGEAGPYQDTLPARLPPLPPYLANLDPVQDTAAFVVFTDSFTTAKPPGSQTEPALFYLGTGEAPYMRYHPDSVFPVRMPVGATQLWKVSSRTTIGISHPFHIHINPFQVDTVVYPRGSGDPNAPLYEHLNGAASRGRPIWLDTFPLPLSSGDTPGYVVIRQRYLDFTGKFVMHCHILGHEERGMMQLVEVVPPGPAGGSSNR